MHVKLDEVRVTATSDGGLSFLPAPPNRCMYPVFSIEVAPLFPLHIFIFCRRSGKNTANATMKQHIKCMPHKYTRKCSAKSVTPTVTQNPKCSKRFRSPPTPPPAISKFNSRRRARRTQAFVLHARHATFYLFYAKFPNTYLRDIHEYGANYRQKSPNPQTIVIQQSAPFRMRYPRDQAACFRLLAHVLCYLVSGNSSVFHMAKDERNPLYRTVTGLNVRYPPAQLLIVEISGI